MLLMIAAKESAKTSNLEVDFPLNLLPRNVTVLSVLANGMFSTVYKAVYKAKPAPLSEAPCEMPFVIKHIKSSNHPKRVLTEMCLLSKLRGRHHIIPVWTLISCNFSYIVIMPYFTHDSFSSFFRDLTRREVANYMYALLDALAYIHQLNVTHRDIKPTNFLYNRRTKRFALIDFGLAEKESRSCLSNRLSASKVANNTNENDVDCDAPPVLLCASKPSSTSREITPGSNFVAVENPPPVQIVLPDPNVIGPSPKKSILSPPVPQLFAIGRVGTLTAKPKAKLSAHSIRRRLRFSDILNVDGVEGQQKVNVDEVKPPTQTENIATINANDNAMDSMPEEKKQEAFARIKSSDSGYSTTSSLHSAPVGCRCDGPSTICGVCQRLPEVQAQRSGTTGYRAPEVLLRSRSQTTAIDVWAAGVVFLIILTGRYPFFTAKVDLEAICQLMSIFGKRKIAELASELGLLLLLPSNCPISEEPPYNLGDFCRTLRAGVPARRLFGQKPGSDSKSRNKLSSSSSRKRTFCQAELTRSPMCVIDSSVGNEFAALAFDLLEKLMEVRPSFRITAEEALKHEFFTKFREQSSSST